MDFKKDYYSILGVARSASKQEIKSAFRDLAKKFHPDKNPGDAGADDRFKEINLAYEVLGNDIARAVYDEYKIKEEQLKQSEPKSPTDKVRSANKQTYRKVSKVQKEHRVYITGDILIKYWADPLNNVSVFSNWQADYKIMPFDAHIRIKDSDIHNYPGMPVDFQKAYTAADLFAVPLSQPVECSVEIAGEEEFYALELHDLRIKNPVITNVTLHDNQVMATMTGDVYAYTLKLTEEEVTEEVTECFGETGQHESKTENNKKYTRTEYFHADCSTYWGPWQLVPDDKDEGGRPKRKVEPFNSDTVAGCLGYWWLIPLVIFTIAFPQLALGIFLFCVGMWFIGLLMNLASSFRGLLTVLSILFLASLIYSVITGGKGRRGASWITTPRRAYDTLVTEEKNIPGEHTNDTIDQLISHHIRWKDYDSTRYATTLSILRSEVNAAQLSHEGINYIPEQTLAPVYDRLATMDEKKMERTYKAFDSIKNRASLDERAFANMVVSCIQSIPYYLVVDQSCNAEQYQNAFITQYLNQCDRDCCIGYSKYGVRSPAEFIGDLKGDCDTRALIIYSLLKHFNYNVALLTSTYYQHAIVAVAFTGGQATEGIAMPIRNQNYLLWETTQAGFRAGEIPPAYQDLDYWSVDLLHEKK